MARTDLLTRPALELAGLVRGGEVSSRELVEASLRRIEAADGAVNAFTTLDAERALEAADGVPAGDARPFAGVPLGIKDLFTAVAGLRQSQGSVYFGDYTPAYDSALVRRLKEAGFVIVGATNTPEFGITPVTESRRWGPARNPWDLGRTPGGSSGGAAAAVASGMVPIAHASDGGGSIRIPAACCGLVGLKPARGRISKAPELGESWLSTDGVVSRTVRDTAAALDVLAGYEPGDSTWAPEPATSFAVAADREPGALRIAVLERPPYEAAIEEVHLTTVRQTAALLAELGHRVEPLALPPLDLDTLLPLFLVPWSTLTDTALSAGALLMGRPARPDDVEPLSWAMHERAQSKTATDYLTSVHALQAFSRVAVATMLPFDAVLSPSLAERPLPIGTINPCSDAPMDDFLRAADFSPFTPLFNITGQPAISLPVEHGEDGLPIGVQLIGRPADEATLLSLSAQIEQARPWSHRVASLEAGISEPGRG